MTDGPIEFKGTSNDVSFVNAMNPMAGIKIPPLPVSLSVKPHALNLSTITNCPRCSKPLVRAMAIDGSQSESFLECPECGTLVNKFKPTKYQAIYLRRTERYKMTAGGFGTGKSRVNIEDVIKHLLLIPGSRVGVFGRSYPALQGTFIKEFYGMFPARLVRSKNEQKHEITLTNGSEIVFRSFDDPTKIKSMNLSMILIVEASDCPYSGFTMSQSRLRNTAAMIPYFHPDGTPVKEYDKRSGEWKIKYRIDVRHIALETNPDSGWVKKDFLLDAAIVEFYGEARNEGYRFNKERDEHKYVQIVSTSANPYLPPTYEEEQTRGKTKAYIMQFYKGSFNFSSNLVFPNFGTIVVPPHELPREFDERGRRVLFFIPGLDYGINDPTHVVFTALSLETRKLYVFSEMRENDTDVKNLSKIYRHHIKTNGTNIDGLLMLPPFDGRSYNKRESDLRTIGGAFEAEGLYFEPSFASHEIRIIKLNALINHEQIEVFSNCEFLIEEALNYKFKLDKNGEPTKKPVDKKDHGVTALEFVVVELPHNLKELRLTAYLPSGTEIKHDIKITKKKVVKKFNPFEEDQDVRNNHGFVNNLTHTGNLNGNRIHGLASPNAMDDESEDDGFNRSLPVYLPRR
jgi:uncharacterized C2H2 Zn-finger protein